MNRLAPLLAVFWLCGCAMPSQEMLLLEPVPFFALPGWGGDCPLSALAAFQASCAKLPASSEVADMAAWRQACANLPADADCSGVRAFFEENFEAKAMATGGGDTGLLTGYYEPELRGSREKSAAFPVPLHCLPGDMVAAELGDFLPDLAGRKITGHVEGGRFLPYPSRADIVSGALDGKGYELLYVDDAADAFFLQVQGSGRVVLADGSVVRLGYAGQNGRAYTAIGRELLARGELKPGGVSMQSIKDWLRANPEKADEVMNTNLSYVFFRELPGGAVGAQNVELTPLRSLAVDRKHVPLGLPVFIEAEDPLVSGAHIRRLMVAQDTGGAIKGPLRGDFFWGPGMRAEARAGVMKSQTRFWLLTPKSLP